MPFSCFEKFCHDRIDLKFRYFNMSLAQAHDYISLTQRNMSSSVPSLTTFICIHTFRLCNTFVYYGLSLFSTSLAGDRYLNFILSGAIELPCYVALYFMVNWVGRRTSVMTFHAIAGVALFTLIGIPEE